jgi:imidazolonepropionase-like amidohydrolase
MNCRIHSGIVDLEISMLLRTAAFCILLVATSALLTADDDPPNARNREAPVAIEHVTILPMTDVESIPDATVVIQGDRILSVGPSADAKLPENAQRIDGNGKWLLPAFADMHVHLAAEPTPELRWGPEQTLSPYIANGVLQVLDMASSEHTNALRDEIAAGKIRGPRIATARMVDGFPPIRWGAATIITTPDQARLVAADTKSAGFDYLKVYSRLDVEALRALIDEAKTQNIRVIGHIPGRRQAKLADALPPGFAMVAHAEEFAYRDGETSDDAIAGYVALAKERGITLTSTLFLNEQIAAQTRDPEVLAKVKELAQVNPVELPMWFESNHYAAAANPERIARLEAIVEFNRKLVRAFVEAGIPVIAGTDTFVPGLTPGYALHEELQALSRAGLSNSQILKAATITSMTWLGVADDRGAVQPGKRANLLLLDANPLDDISNTTAIAAVIHDGKLLQRADLNKMMSDLDALYAPFRETFSPRAAKLLNGDQR